MHSPDTSSPESSSSHPAAAAQRVFAVRMPIETPVEETEEAVEQLRQCSSAELRRARTHHRRALEALRNGGYSNLSEPTRKRLTDQLRSNLDALNRALETSSPEAPPPTPTEDEHDADTAAPVFSRVWAFVQSLW